jgi:hypothetical protein
MVTIDSGSGRKTLSGQKVHIGCTYVERQDSDIPFAPILGETPPTPDLNSSCQSGYNNKMINRKSFGLVDSRSCSFTMSSGTAGCSCRAGLV